MQETPLQIRIYKPVNFSLSTYVVGLQKSNSLRYQYSRCNGLFALVSLCDREKLTQLIGPCTRQKHRAEIAGGM
jgi:hypothetical protein